MGLKIALVSPYDFPYPGGVTEHIIALAHGLRRRGHQVYILAACSGYQGKTFPNIRAVTKRVTTIPIGGASARVGLSPLSYINAKKILQREAFDVVHLHEPLTPSITWPVLMHAHALPHAVTIGTFHAYHEQPHWFYVWGQPIFGKFFAMLDSLIAVSRPAYQFAYQMFPGDYRIIPNGIDLSRFGKEQQIHTQNQKVTILFVGRLDKRKGFLNLLEAFVNLKPDYPDLQLKVVGPFEPEACQPYKKIVQAHHRSDVEFVGYVSPERLPHFYHNADIFCAPSIGFESFGIVLLEAMAARLPIVASDIAGYRSLMSHGQEGFLVPPGDSVSLEHALRRLLDQSPLRQEMGQRGWLKARTYNWEHIVDGILELYLETIENKTKTRCRHLSYAKSGMGDYAQIQGRHANYVKRNSTQI